MAFLGMGLLPAGLLLFLCSLREFRRERTSLRLDRPATRLLREGPYRFSRNPVYVSLSVLLAGLGCCLENPWIVAMVVPAIAVLSLCVIPREEAYLESKFGAEYAAYRASVCRWLGTCPTGDAPIDADRAAGSPALSKGAIAALLALGGLVFVGLYYDVGLNYSDEGIAIDSAVRILRGEMIVRDFAQPPHGAFYLLALFFKLLGRIDAVDFRAAMALLKVLSAVLVFLLACRVVPPRWALMPALITLTFSGPFHKAPLVLVYVALPLVASWLSDRPSRLRSAVAGAVLGLFAFWRIEIAASILIFVTPWLVAAARQGWLAHWRVLVAVAAGVLLFGTAVAVAIAAPFGWHSMPTAADVFTEDGWNRAVRDRFLGVPEQPIWRLPMLAILDFGFAASGGLHAARDWAQGWTHPREPGMRLGGCPEMLLLPMYFLVLLFETRASYRRQEWPNLLLACVSAAALLKLAVRVDLAHFAQFLPMGALLVTMAVWRATQTPCGPWLAFALRRVIPAVALVAWALLVVESFWLIDSYAGSIGILRTAEVRLPYRGFELRTTRADAQELRELLDFVNASRKPGDRILALPFCPLLYALLDTPAPSCYSMVWFPPAVAPASRRHVESLSKQVALSLNVRWVILDGNPAYQTPPLGQQLPVLWADLCLCTKVVFDNGRFVVRKAVVSLADGPVRAAGTPADPGRR